MASTSCLISRVGASAKVGGSVDGTYSNYHGNGCVDHAKGVSRQGAGWPNLVVQGHSCPGIVLQNPAGGACLSSMPFSLEACGMQWGGRPMTSARPACSLVCGGACIAVT